MKKKVLVLVGSPRSGGNSDLMADAFIKGAAGAGHEVVKVRADLKNIGGCKACDACYSKGAACVFDDGFNEIAPLLESSDVIVMSTPVYWYTFPTQLKAVIDKMYALYGAKRAITGKECAFMACAGDDGDAVFEGIAKSWEMIAGLLGWRDRGRLFVPGVYGVGEIEKTDALAQAEKLGADI